MRVIPLVLALLLLAVPAADAKHKRKHRCAVRDAVVVLHNQQAVILSAETSDSVNSDTTYYGCLRSKRKPFQIASEGSDQYITTSIKLKQLHGVYFSYAESYGDINHDCHSSVNVVSIRTRASRSTTPAPTKDCSVPSKLVATATGSLAWTVAGEEDRFVRKFDPAGEGTLDQGPGSISPRSTSSATS